MKKYLIIGATSGIGLAVTKKLLADGHKVFGVGRNLGELGGIEKTNPLLKTAHYDITLSASEAVIREAHELMGTIDAIFLNSGIATGSAFNNWEEIYPMILTNVTGTTEFLLNGYQYMKKNNPAGVIAVNTSIAGLHGLRQAPVYSASKAYLINLCEALRSKCHKENPGIKIVDIRPGFVDTKMSGGTFWQCSAPKAAKLIVDGMENRCSVVYVSRRWKAVALLLKLLPRFILDRA